jgi:phenylalanine ammonia-lyase
VSQLAALFHLVLLTFLPRNGKVVNIDGQTLSIAAVTATARHQASVQLDDSPHIRERLHKSRAVIAKKVSSGASVYGLSTGFGGSGELPVL